MDLTRDVLQARRANLVQQYTHLSTASTRLEGAIQLLDALLGELVVVPPEVDQGKVVPPPVLPPPPEVVG
jgi:hypothetical protein